MVLIDTSVWVDHFRTNNLQLVGLLNDGDACCHPFIIGDLACGSINNRVDIISLLQALPQATLIDQVELLYFIEKKRLMAKGLGLVDMHLLASVAVEKFKIMEFGQKIKTSCRKAKD